MLYLARTLAALGLLIALSSWAGAAPVATSIDSRLQKLEGKMEEMMVASKSNEDEPKRVKEKFGALDTGGVDYGGTGDDGGVCIIA